MRRRELLKALGASAVVRAVAPGFHPLVPPLPGETEWKPRLFTAHENETVTVLSELIIPETDTPGARAARVNQHIDFFLSRAPSAVGERFRLGLAWLDRRSRELHGRDFIDADGPAQTALLNSIADGANSKEDPKGIEFFKDIKERTLVGYYSSRVGMLDELGYAGNMYLSRFDGCTHPEHSSFSPTPRKAVGD
jgi:hypothetical protein